MLFIIIIIIAFFVNGLSEM